MQGHVGIDGSTVVLLFGDGRSPRTRPLTPRHFGPANDNGPRDPVRTVTVRKTLERMREGRASEADILAASRYAERVIARGAVPGTHPSDIDRARAYLNELRHAAPLTTVEDVTAMCGMPFMRPPPSAAERILAFVSRSLPMYCRDEHVGDALEAIERLGERGASRLRVGAEADVTRTEHPLWCPPVSRPQRQRPPRGRRREDRAEHPDGRILPPGVAHPILQRKDSTFQFTKK